MITRLKVELKTTGLVIFSGLMLTASLPKIDLQLLAWAALVPLLWSLRGNTPGAVFRHGMLFGIAHCVSLLYWLVPTMVSYGRLPLIISIGILFLFAAILSLLFFAPAVSGISIAGRTPGRLLFFFPTFWAGTEFLRSFLFTGFPWGLLGYSQYSVLRLIQLSDMAGVYGLSWVIAFVNAALFLLALAVLRQPWQGHPVKLPVAFKSIAAAGVLIGASWIYGDLRITQTDRLAAQAPMMRVALIQGNIEQSQKWDPAFQTATIEKYNRLSLSTRPLSPELIVWPESAAPFYFLAEVPQTRMVMQAIATTGAHFLIGAPSFTQRLKDVDYYNSAYLVDPNGRVLGKYDKAHLVPYGEYTPFKEYLPFLGKMVEHVGDFKPGVKGHTLAMQDFKLGVQICYEIIFPALSRAMVQNGARLLITITNDAWYGKTAGPYQHFSIAVLRAVENRRTLVRAANTGISGFIDPAGRVLSPTPLMDEAAVVRDLPLMEAESFYARFGDVFAAACLVSTIAISLWELLRRRRNRYKKKT